jgi:hypothetical protein
MRHAHLIIAVFAIFSGCASWQVSYQPTGRYDETKKQTFAASSLRDVMLYIGEIPEGFHYNDGVLYVDTTYGNMVLGPLLIEVKKPPIGLTLLHAVFTLGISAAFTSLPPDLDRESVVRMLQKKCFEIGGNAVMSAVIPNPGFKGYGVFGGMAIIQKQPAKTPEATKQ